MRRTLVLFLAVAAAYAAGSQLAYSWFGADGLGASFFPAAGVTMAALLLTARRSWPVVIAAAATAEILVDLAHGISLLASAGYAVANTVQPLVGALALTAVLAARPDLARTRDLTAFLAVAVVGASAVGGALGATTFVVLADGSGWWRFAAEWWVGDGLGILVVGTGIIALANGRPSSRRRLVETLALAGAAALGTLAVVSLEWLPAVFVPMTLLVASGFRVGTRGVALVGAVVAVIAAQATAEGSAYWESLDVSPATGLLYLQLTLAVLIATALGVAAAVNERERDAAARATAERFAELADAAPAILWVTDAGNRCTYLSPAWSESTGQPVEEGLGTGWLDAVHPDDRADVTEAFQRAAARREPFAIDHRLRRADGDHRWVIDAGRPRQGPGGEWLGYVGSVIDVDERVRAVQTLRESERRFRTMFDAIDEGYCLCELVLDDAGRPRDYRFLEVNPAFEEMTGLSDAAGRAAYEMVPDLEPHWLETYAEVALEGRPMRFESGSDAMGRWFDVFATPVEARGRFALLFTDVTERRRGEEALRESEEAERRARRRAELVASVIGDLEGVEGVAARATCLLDLLVPRVADVAVIAPAGGGEPLASRGGDPAGAHSRLELPLDLGARTPATLRLALTDPSRRPYSADDAAFLTDLAGRAAVLLGSARVHEEEREVALRLQRALLPDDLRGGRRVAIAARYAAASDALEVGGDWYDAFDLPDGRLALAVGDVVGHGLEAAAAMGRLRTALAALAPHAADPGDLLARLHQFAEGPNGSDFATACYAVLDPATGTLEYASAGHPPMLVVEAGGATRWLDAGRSSPLCRLPVGPRGHATTTLPPGALLLMFTDGLFERRREPLHDGLSRLERIARDQAGAAPGDACARIVQSMVEDGRNEDDVVVLAVRLAPDPARPFRVVVPARPDELRGIRSAVRAWLDERGVDDDARVGLLLALGEACANAVQHAYADRPPGDVEVEVAPGDDGELLVRVRDFGSWRPPRPEAGVGGHGTDIMRSVSLELLREEGPDGTTVRLRVPAPRGTA